ncbi:alpha/beta fold hydrolase [Tistrella bauzanensis]|jgi:pimeloyl-ACP methyl ester carboxylesterase|uniref:Alpha/beta fold hydrolase n=1 Tax=Tistrella arctica TaxID=3133430 RepID=A0ABU9YSF0_9PROT
MAAYRASTPVLDQAGMLAAGLGQAVILPLRPQDETMLEQAEPFRFGPHDSRQAWSVGEGPVVMLVHGYSGRGVQMASLALRIARQGYRCVFFDAGGHGASRPEKVGFHTFIADTHDLFTRLDTPVRAMIGHSAGGLAMMRARALHGVHADRYAVISAPLFPYVPLESMRRQGAFPEALDHVKAILSDQFQTSWSSLSGGIAYTPEADGRLLAIYDTTDQMVEHSDAEALAVLWPGCRVVKTAGYGHNRILQAEETGAAVCAFLAD